MLKREVDNTKKRIQRALYRYENEKVYLTEVCDEYGMKIASVYFCPLFKEYEVTYKKFINKRNDYKTLKSVTYQSVDEALAAVSNFVGPEGR